MVCDVNMVICVACFVVYHLRDFGPPLRFVAQSTTPLAHIGPWFGFSVVKYLQHRVVDRFAILAPRASTAATNESSLFTPEEYISKKIKPHSLNVEPRLLAPLGVTTTKSRSARGAFKCVIPFCCALRRALMKSDCGDDGRTRRVRSNADSADDQRIKVAPSMSSSS